MKTQNALFSAQGSVHLDYHKQTTAALPVETLPLPAKLVVSMSQHLGAPAKPIVKKGDLVARGQLVGEPSGFLSAAIHSPTSGKVIAVGDKPTLSGQLVPAIDIEPDGEDRWDIDVKSCPDWQTLDSKTLLERVAEAGIVGMGGAGFPSHVKLSPPPEKQIDIFIINGAECEPYLTADHRLMVEYAGQVWKGAEIIRKILGAHAVRVAIEDNKPDAIKAMTRVMNGTDTELVILKTQYPQGAEKQLIYAVTGREIPSGGLPMDVSVLVQNAGTCAAIYQAVVEGHPLIERIMTVTGDLLKTPKNLRVRVGAQFSDLIEFCGGLSDMHGKIICGGPMMGIAQHSLETAVTKTTSGIVFMPVSQVQQFASMPCISCGRCIPACPMGLMPCMLSELIESEDYDNAESENVLDCIECGSCAYECPAHRPLVQHIRKAKAEITARRRERELKEKVSIQAQSDKGT